MNLYDKSSLILVPGAVKGGKVYSQRPENGDGDFTFSRASTATRVNENGLIESVSSNTPRLDYSGGASCPTLLLEPQRQNLMVYSEYMVGQASTIYRNDTISPEGVDNALRLEEDTATSTHCVFRSEAIPTNASVVTYTISIFAKKKERDKFNFGFYADGTSHNSPGFDLTNGTYPGGSEGSIEDYGNGWYRCSYTRNITQSTGGYNFVRAALIHNNTTYYAGDGSSSMYFYGWQFEEGSYPTSYIPTFGTSQTRSGDNAYNSVTNTTNRTYFLEGKRFADDDFNTSFPFYDPNDGLAITFWNANRLRFRFGGTVNQYYTLTGDDFKIAISFDGTDSKIFINGVYWTTQTFNLGTLTSIILNGDYGALSYKQTLLFPTALTDSECIALTTL